VRKLDVKVELKLTTVFAKQLALVRLWHSAVNYFRVLSSGAVLAVWLQLQLYCELSVTMLRSNGLEGQLMLCKRALIDDPGRTFSVPMYYWYYLLHFIDLAKARSTTISVSLSCSFPIPRTNSSYPRAGFAYIHRITTVLRNWNYLSKISDLLRHRLFSNLTVQLTLFGLFPLPSRSLKMICTHVLQLRSMVWSSWRITEVLELTVVVYWITKPIQRNLGNLCRIACTSAAKFTYIPNMVTTT
jgi:hypothetical protein